VRLTCKYCKRLLECPYDKKYAGRAQECPKYELCGTGAHFEHFRELLKEVR